MAQNANAHSCLGLQTDHLYFHRPSTSPSAKGPQDPSISSSVRLQKSVDGVMEAEISK